MEIKIVMEFGVRMKIGVGMKFEMKIGIRVGMELIVSKIGIGVGMEYGLEIEIGFGLLHMYSMKHVRDNESLVVSIWVFQVEVDTLQTTVAW